MQALHEWLLKLSCKHLNGIWLSSFAEIQVLKLVCFCQIASVLFRPTKHVRAAVEVTALSGSKLSVVKLFTRVRELLWMGGVKHLVVVKAPFSPSHS